MNVIRIFILFYSCLFLFFLYLCSNKTFCSTAKSIIMLFRPSKIVVKNPT